MITKHIIYNEQVRKSLQTGVDKVANAVKVTLGARGRNVIISNEFEAPHITKDGVTVARSIDLIDEIERVGGRIVQDVAANTALIAGDGTTTATVLVQAILTEGLKLVAAGMNPMDIKKGIDVAVAGIVTHLKELAIPVADDFDKIVNIATISANNDSEIGILISDAFKQIGKDGIISIEQSNTMDTYIKVVDGFRFNRGFVSPHFITNESRREVELLKPLILITDKKIATMSALLPALSVAKQNNRPLLIIAESTEGEALNGLVINKLKGNLQVAAVQAPEFGDIKKSVMEDIALLTGAIIITESRGYKLENVDGTVLGEADKVIITRDHTTIIGSKGDVAAIQRRKEAIESLIALATHDFEKEKLQQRLAQLSGGVAMMYVGAPTEFEIKEKVDRIDDAIRATKAAIEEGIVPGGGVALIRCSKDLAVPQDANAAVIAGMQLIKSSARAPLFTICANAGEDSSYIIRYVAEANGPMGYDARANSMVNMIATGIIDPAKVVRTALENAASAASMLLTSECLIINVRDSHNQ